MNKKLILSICSLGLLVTSLSQAAEKSRKPTQIGNVGTHVFAADFSEAKKITKPAEKLEIYTALLASVSTAALTVEGTPPDSTSQVKTSAEALHEIFSSGSSVEISRDAKLRACRLNVRVGGPKEEGMETRILEFECKKDQKGRVQASKFNYYEIG